MSTPPRAILRLTLLGSLALGTAWLAFGRGATETVAQTPPVALRAVPITPPAAPVVKAEDRPADRAAVLAAINSLTKAFAACDAKGLAAHWTNEGEYISTDGHTVRGRADIEKAYTGFDKAAGNSVEFDAEEVRFPSRDTAMAEGYMKLHTGKSPEITANRCSLLMAREEGQWKVVILREWSSEGVSIRELEFLIGSWNGAREDVEIHSTYEWTDNKAFIRCQFRSIRDGKTTSAIQMIGKDPASGALRVWTFESEGGLGEATMTHADKKWVFDAHAVLTDGSTLSATNQLTPIDRDTFLWQSVERTLNDVPQPDLPPIKMTRVKPEAAAK